MVNSLDVAQHQHLAVVVGERADGRREVDPQLGLGPGRKAQIVLDGFELPCRTEAASREPYALPADNCEHPPGKGGYRPQAADAPVQNAERILHGIIDIGGRARGSRITPDIGLRHGEQRGDRTGIATLGVRDEVSVGHQALPVGFLPIIAQAGQ